MKCEKHLLLSPLPWDLTQHRFAKCFFLQTQIMLEGLSADQGLGL